MRLLFGLPGTGKSTAAAASKHHISLDLGSEQLSVSQLYKLRTFTTQLVHNGGDTVVDSYPLYFDPAEIAGECEVTFAIPTRSKEEVLRRVAKRDGEDSEFYRLYVQRIDQWISDWQATVVKWRKYFPRLKVVEVYHTRNNSDRTYSKQPTIRRNVNV